MTAIATTTAADTAYDVVVLGAGYAGLMAALRLRGRKGLRRVALVNAEPGFVERVRLQERIVGPVAPRLPPLAGWLAGSGIEFIQGEVEALDAERRQVLVRTAAGDLRRIAFDRCIYGLGSRIDPQAAAGVAEHAYRLDPGDGARSAVALGTRLAAATGEAVRVVVVGGGNTATEAAAEIKAAWPLAEVTMAASRRAGDFGRGPGVERLTREALERQGVRLVDGETACEVRAEEVIMASGRRLATDVCVWAGGLRAPPIAAAAGLAVDGQGRIWVGPTLASVSHPRILAVGDAAHPTGPTGADYRMSAFAALCSGAYAADRVLNGVRGRQGRPFSFSAYGQGVAIGREGVGFFTYPDDRRGFLVMTGKTALGIRNLFVWMLIAFLKLERSRPGAYFWLGRGRVSWDQAASPSAAAPSGSAPGRDAPRTTVDEFPAQ
jgi:NADH dehydrogenase FAD-containing subunit